MSDEPKAKVDGKRDKKKNNIHNNSNEIDFGECDGAFDVVKLGKDYSIYGQNWKYNQKMPADGGILKKKSDSEKYE